MFDSDEYTVGSEAGETDSEYSTGIPELDQMMTEIGGERTRRFPSDLDQLHAGLHLHAVTEAWDRSEMTGHDLVLLLKAQPRMVAHTQAELLETMAEIAYRTDPGFGLANEPVEFASSEIRTALKLTRRAAERLLGLGLDLKQRIPRVLEMLREGWIDLPRAQVISEGTCCLPVGKIEMVLDRILPVAPELSTGQLRAALARIVIEVAPETASEQFEAGVETRMLVREANPDGTANLKATSLDPVETEKAYRRVHALAKHLKKLGDPRTMDQLRADLLLRILNGEDLNTILTIPADVDTRVGGTVDIRVDLNTLIGLNDHPGELAGYGPVLAEITRQTVETMTGAEWQTTVVDSETGLPMHVGVLKRRPSKTEAAEVRARDLVCVFPTCRMPARDCDLDHRIQHSKGGPTHPLWMEPMCRWDHRGKDQGGWKITYDPTTGVYTFTSPLGHTYQTRPHKPP